MELLEIINELVVDNIDKSVDFYKKYFSFQVIEKDGTPISWVKMKKDNCVIMFESYKQVSKEIDNYPKKAIPYNLIKFKYKDKAVLSNLYTKFQNDNINFFMKWTNTEYGNIEFGIFDPDENMIIISC